MAVEVAVELLTGDYHAADAGDRDRAEWPPHPARLFCALVAAARDDRDWECLRWLERQGPPLVLAADRWRPVVRSGFVVTNSLHAQGKNQFHPGRTNGLRVRVKAVPSDPVVRFVWPDADPGGDPLRVLDALARRVPYLGRSTGVALVSASARRTDAGPTDAVDDPTVHAQGPGTDGASDVGTSTSVYEPCSALDAQVSVRVPYPGYADVLEEQFEAGRSAWEVGRWQGYRLRRPAGPARSVPDLVPSVYADLVGFLFTGLRPDGRLAPVLTEALRSAVLRSGFDGTDVPSALHGHGAEGRPHVAFLALPDVGGEHADGHLLGLAVAVPRLPDDERRAVLGRVLGLRDPGDAQTVRLPVPGVGVVDLAYRPGAVRPWGASPERWRRGARCWATATPVVLDRYPKKGEEAADVVRRSCRRTGLPDPVEVEVSPQPLLRGAVRLRPSDIPGQSRGRLFRHVRLTFDRPVSGPVMLGAGRYLGVGLFAPVTDGRSPEGDGR